MCRPVILCQQTVFRDQMGHPAFHNLVLTKHVPSVGGHGLRGGVLSPLRPRSHQHGQEAHERRAHHRGRQAPAQVQNAGESSQLRVRVSRQKWTNILY